MIEDLGNSEPANDSLRTMADIVIDTGILLAYALGFSSSLEDQSRPLASYGTLALSRLSQFRLDNLLNLEFPHLLASCRL